MKQIPCYDEMLNPPDFQLDENAFQRLASLWKIGVEVNVCGKSDLHGDFLFLQVSARGSSSAGLTFHAKIALLMPGNDVAPGVASLSEQYVHAGRKH